MPDQSLNKNNTGSQPIKNKISILYVDDEEHLLTLGKLFLERTGDFMVDIMTSGQEALSSSRIQSYDAVISDYQMPRMDGIAFLKAFREQFEDIPFILFTGRGREEVVIEAINNGADFYLQKGGDPKSQFAELSHKIQQAVRRKQAERSLQESEKRLSDIIEFLPDATFAVDQSGRVIAWNRAIEEMTGVSSGEMLGKGDFEYALPFYGFRRPLLIDLIHEPKEIISQFYSNLYRSSTSITAESDLSHPKGNRIATLIKACPLYNQAGEITGAIESIRDTSEAKRTGFELKESESKFRNLVEYSRDGILIVDFNGIIQFVNPTGLIMTDEEESGDVIGKKNFWEYVHPDSHEVVSRDMHLVAQGIDGYTARYKLITAKNREIWVESLGRKIPHLHSEAILVSLRDITERKQAEDTLLESEEKFRSFAELQPQMIYELDMDLNFTYVNRHGLSMLDASIQNFREGLHALSFIHPTHHSKVKDNVQKQLGGIPYELEEYLAVRKDGSTYPINIYSSLIYRHGKVTGFRGVVVDISERKNIEAELKESEEKFRALVEQSHDGTIIIDFTGNLLFANPRIGEIIGHPHVQDLVGRANIFSFVLPEFHEQTINQINQVKSGDDSFWVNYPISTIDKSVIWIECIGKKITYGGSPTLLLSIHDITERKKAEDALRESEQKMGALFMNNPVPLTVVSAVDGVFVDVNEAFVQKTGFTRKDVISSTSEALRLFPDADQYRKLISSLRDQNAVSGMEISCRISSGEIRSCRFSSGMIMMGGKPHILSSIEDITESKNMQTAFEALVRSMVGTTGISAIRSITDNLSSLLKADCTMIGEIQPDKKTVKVLSMLLDGEEISNFSYTLEGTPCDNVMEKGFCLYPDNAAMLFPDSPDLQELNIRGYIGTPLRNFEGQVLGILCVLCRNPIQPSSSVQKIMDIIAVKAAAEIERTQIDQTLIKTRNMLEEAMNLANIVNWEYDVGADQFTFDDRFYALYATTAEREGGYQMTSETYAREFLYPDDVKMVAQELEKAIQTTDPNYLSYVDHRIIRRDGEPRYVNFRIRIIKDGQGRTIKTYGVNQDITEIRGSEEVIRKANLQLNLLTSVTRLDVQ